MLLARVWKAKQRAYIGIDTQTGELVRNKWQYEIWGVRECPRCLLPYGEGGVPNFKVVITPIVRCRVGDLKRHHTDLIRGKPAKSDDFIEVGMAWRYDRIVTSIGLDRN